MMELQEFCTDLSVLDHPVRFQEGQILLIDKPLEWTSFDVVKKIRSRLQHGLKLKKLKVGHAGTLDPLASGLVIVCIGKATKKIDSLMGQEKCYEAKIKFGATTPSFDLETAVDKEYPVDHINSKKTEECLSGFLGEQEQVPPQYSAVKVEGKRAYLSARKGEEVEIKPRRVIFYELELRSFENLEAIVDIKCSKGTYIRSFARDLGIALESGAHLSGLRRTAIGSVAVDKAMSIEDFDREFDQLREQWNQEGLIGVPMVE